MVVNEVLPLLKLHGRTRIDGDCLYFNWTCSGFSVGFRGRRLRAKLKALGETQPFPPNSPEEFPWAAVTVDGSEEFTSRFECRDEGWYTLFEASDGEPHTVRLIKLTENARGKLGLLELEADGGLFALPEEKKLTIEFVGDSITCGFGNECTDRDGLFDPAEENGWITYAAIAARELGAEFSCVSVSGISANAPEKSMFPMKPMRELYPYADRLYDDRAGHEPQKWDFASAPRDLVFINLGTNDVNPIRFYRELEQADREEAHFVKAYKEFVTMIRQLNGPDTRIVCSLGPMDYYLFDNIRTAVSEYRQETGDEKVHVVKLIGINLMSEGFGAVGHPSAKTHARVGKELAARLRGMI